MSQTVAELLRRLVPDLWRESTPFSAEMADANRLIFEAEGAVDEIRGVLRRWLMKHQPCLFGRIAASAGLISYCILTDQDLRQDDAAICDKIQDARTQWTREGFFGRRSGFLLLAASPTLAHAAPDENLRALAQRLCSLYLLREINADEIYHEQLFLEQPGGERRMWQWLAGVNYFCANGDGRWWQDHRIPGGLAFSVNSVGHMAKTGGLARDTTRECLESLGIPTDAYAATPVNSLGRALEFALRTIAKAADTTSGRATELLPLGDRALSAPKCPIPLPAFLVDKEFRYYKGYYHTDFTLPSEYFLADVHRPSHCKARTMELTYLIDPGVDNPDYITMGAGRRIRGPSGRAARITPTSELIDSNERLRRALGTG